ncbi:hypothetical protein NE237_021057 [Protea cynaroides]|uniref:CCHC-type domain-containing protein n=1 Tax=Protea cynaroides TaxID=273540 RepID=A0A9Q0H794_9MAGN|nr:hypothetical protein NE237_021057 [Protea cynaroides]
MGTGACYCYSEMGHRAKECSLPYQGKAGQLGKKKDQPKGQAGQWQKGQVRIYAVIAHEVKGGPNVVAGSVSLQGKPAFALFDSGATPSFVKKLGFKSDRLDT